MIRPVILSALLVLPLAAVAQASGGYMKKNMPQDKAMEGMHHTATKPSTELIITAIDGKTVRLSPADIKELPHITVTVNNAHTKATETYAGVPVSELLKRVDTVPNPSSTETTPQTRSDTKSKTSPRMTILIAGATDNFHVVLTLCDTDPTCHNGQVIVADQMDEKPLIADGAFKLIVTEDKKPARWAHNLNSLTLKSAE